MPDGLSSHIPSPPGTPHRGVGTGWLCLLHPVTPVGTGPTPWIQMDGLMHYSPFAAGTGLFFVAILVFFLLTNLYGAASGLIPRSRRSGGRHAQRRSGMMSLRA